jgi:NAD(P)-dependent dehydrogenase (short-subunit alcohol dehydrogenase family)
MCPGLITTPGHVKAAKEVDDMLLAKVPMKRFGVPDEITDGLTFLCSDMASFMTGCTFVSRRRMEAACCRSELTATLLESPRKSMEDVQPSDQT